MSTINNCKLIADPDLPMLEFSLTNKRGEEDYYCLMNFRRYGWSVQAGTAEMQLGYDGTDQCTFYHYSDAINTNNPIQESLNMCIRSFFKGRNVTMEPGDKFMDGVISLIHEAHYGTLL